MRRRQVIRRRVALAAVLIAVTLVMSPRAQIPPTVYLSVPDRSSATPWVAATGEFVAVAWGATAPGGKADVFVAVSHDAGATFGTPVRVNRVPGDARLHGEIPPRVSVHPAQGSHEVVVLWNAQDGGTAIKIARSGDAGRTFRAPETLQKHSAPGDRGWPSLTLDRNGRAHAIWLDHRGLSDASSGHQAAASASAMDGVAMAQRSGLYYSSGTAERELVNGVCYCCKTTLVPTPSGMLFAGWRHVYPGNLRDIAVITSRDEGRTFSAPARVSDDNWHLNGCPDDGPAMTADSSGLVHIVWPTVVTDGQSVTGALFYATTRDGVTFTPRTRVPTLGGPKPTHAHIAVDDAGRAFVAWDEARDGVRQAFVRTAERARDGRVTFGPITTLGTREESNVYPILAATSRGRVDGTIDRRLADWRPAIARRRTPPLIFREAVGSLTLALARLAPLDRCARAQQQAPRSLAVAWRSNVRTD